MDKFNIDNLKQTREQLGLDQSEMAELMGYSGATSYSYAERNGYRDTVAAHLQTLHKFHPKLGNNE